MSMHRAVARRRVDRRLGFYIHLAVYVLVNLGLMAIDLTSSPFTLWFHWPLLGWGLGVFFHGLAVYAAPQLHSVKERMVDRELKR